MKYIANVYVSLKPTVNDPEGITIRDALRALGFDAVADVRSGKFLRIELDSESEAAAAASVEGMCDRLLANPVIERYDFSVRPNDLPPKG